jgi:hypothetical protein
MRVRARGTSIHVTPPRAMGAVRRSRAKLNSYGDCVPLSMRGS